MGRMLPELIHTHRPERIVHPLTDLRRRDADILRPEGHIFLHNGGNQLVVRVLEHHAHRLPDVKELVLIGGIHAVHITGTAAGQQHRIEMLCQGALARAVVSQHCHELPFPDGDGEVLQHRDHLSVVRFIAEADVLRTDKIFHRFSSRSPKNTAACQHCQMAVLPQGNT